MEFVRCYCPVGAVLELHKGCRNRLLLWICCYRVRKVAILSVSGDGNVGFDGTAFIVVYVYVNLNLIASCYGSTAASSYGFIDSHRLKYAGCHLL